MMRRILVLLTVALMMVVVMMASVLPAFAEPNPRANCIGKTASEAPENVAEGAIVSTPGPFGIGAAASSDCGSR
jgi:mannose-6-phosphate isomerase-like protein (cupin superfamily)